MILQVWGRGSGPPVPHSGPGHVETEMLVHDLFNKTASINGMTAQVGNEGDPNKYLHPLNFLYATIQPYLAKRDIFVPGHT